MVISDLSIRRPVLAVVMSLVLVLLGLVGYSRLSVREYPKIDPPVVTVNTTYSGASAAIIESQVTQVLEDSLAGIEGIDYMSSISREESSQITVSFKLTRDPDAAASDVRDRVSRVRSKLPDDIDEPVVQKTEADAQPIIYLAFFSDRHSAMQITDYANRYVKDSLQTLPGVAEVRIFGERRPSMRIWLDPMRMAAYRMTPQDVEEALRRQNVEIPGGRIESRQREFTVLSETDLKTPAEFEDIILRQEKGYLVRLRDVGRAEVAPADERKVVRFNGRNAVALGIVKQATANPLDVSLALRHELPGIVESLPEGMQLRIAHDKSQFIEESIKNVYETIGEAVVLVVLIIFLFLRSLRAVLIPFVTIPVALIGAFAIMFAMDFSINTLTLLAMVLAIGLVVDDAIVMMENIFRHVENGMPPVRAAFQGSREIAFAVMAMTLTLAAVYVPIGFMTGTTGRLFTEFAWTLAGAVLVSGFVALTLSPMMCSKLLHHQRRHGMVYNFIEGGLTGLIAGYRRLLGLCFRVRPLVLLIGLAVAGSGVWFFFQLKPELAPYEDQSTVVAFGSGPVGATIQYTAANAERMERLVEKVPEVDRYFMVAGYPTVSQIIGFVKLKPWGERQRSQQDITRELAPRMFAIPGVLGFATNPPPLGQRASRKPVQFVIQTSGPYSELEQMSDRFLDAIRENPNLVNLDSDLKLNKPQLKVSVNRDKAADLGIPVAVIGRALETMFGGRQVTRYKQNGEQYDVIVRVADVDRSNPSDLSRVYIRAAGGEMVQLSNLVHVDETVAPKELNHFNQLRAATISANLAPGYTIGEALNYLDQKAHEVLPASARIDYSGESRDYKEASAGIYMTFVLALIFIYLVLSAQFESFRDPFIIMLTVPLSITGGLLMLYLMGGTLNIYSQVGLVTLIGLITKHGILIVDFSNQLRERGEEMFQAVTEAAVLRLRPILMTTGAMVIGAVPLALATGAGAASRQSIGWVIVGGLLVGTLFTLFVIPVTYTYIAKHKKFAHVELAREAAATRAEGGRKSQQPAE
ncbi:MAG TPA: efflux RND transporter permease subunit [Alphaproteobacteria bacterium]|nr:efflux RND transporter permease subunit [Alphaproteobacteria bacterium]